MDATTTVEIDGQYRELREGAGFVPRELSVVAVTGADAAEYLHSQVTQEIEALEVGSGAYAALLNRKARMQADMTVLRVAADELWLLLEPVGLPAALRHLTMYSIGREVQIADASSERITIAVIGPAAAERLGIAPLGAEGDNAAAEIGGVAVHARRSDFGFDLIAAAEDAAALTTALEQAGIVPVSVEAAEILRVESGRPRFGREITTETIPQEAGVNERAVSFTKGCYIGQETVARLHYKGKPNRHLRGLRLDNPASAGDEVRLGERELGVVGTAVVSPIHGPIALAILRREAEPGDRVTVGEANGGEVIEPPFG